MSSVKMTYCTINQLNQIHMMFLKFPLAYVIYVLHVKSYFTKVISNSSVKQVFRPVTLANTVLLQSVNTHEQVKS